MLAGSLLVGGLAGLEAVVGQEQNVPQQSQETAEQRLERRIAEFMKLSDQNSVLEQYITQGFVQQVSYDSARHQSNFRELVYQDSVEAQNKKPVLVFFYTRNTKQSTENIAVQTSSNRTAVVFALLSERLHDNVEFIAYNLRDHPEYVETEQQRRFPEEVRNSISGVPDMVLYNRFDLAIGETSQKNNGIIKKVDIIGGGPKKDSQIAQWLNDLPLWWIEPNSFGKPTPDNDGVLYRFNGTGNYVVVQNCRLETRK